MGDEFQPHRIKPHEDRWCGQDIDAVSARLDGTQNGLFAGKRILPQKVIETAVVFNIQIGTGISKLQVEVEKQDTRP